MHHVVLDRWSRLSSPLHDRDARAKILTLTAFLAAVATTPQEQHVARLGYVALLAAGLGLSRLPAAGLLTRAAAVLPFSATFALITWLSGDGARAWMLLEKSYLSAAAVLLLAGTTPMPQLMRGLESLGAPRFVVLVVQFLYRYLFVVSEQAQHMRLAARSRAGAGVTGRVARRNAAGALAVLFARSFQRAEGIHQAMLARGFTGRFPAAAGGRFRLPDAVFLLAGVTLPLALRLGGVR